MTFQIIIKRKDKWKGKNVSEMARNLESEGWPSEFASEEARDRVKSFERREGRPIKRRDINKVLPK